MLEILKESFKDVCGTIDGKLLTAFFSAMVIFTAVVIYYVWGLELPDKYWYTFAGFVSLGTGLGSIERITQFLTNKPNSHDTEPETGSYPKP